MVRAPSPSNSSFDITTPGLRALRIAVTPTPMFGRELRQRRQRRQADAAAEHHDILPARLEREADAERAGDVELVAGVEHRHAARAASLGLVEKLDLTVRLVDAVDAHRPAHPHLGAIGRRAEQVEHLARIGLQRVLMHLQDQVLVFLVDRNRWRRRYR